MNSPVDTRCDRGSSLEDCSREATGIVADVGARRQERTRLSQPLELPAPQLLKRWSTVLARCSIQLCCCLCPALPRAARFLPQGVPVLSRTRSLHGFVWVVLLSCTALQAANIKYTPATGGFYFNHQVVNTPSTPQTVTLTNLQSSAISISKITSTAQFPFTSACGNSLPGGASCSIKVSFNPSAVTTYNANLVITNSSSIPQITILLTGTGINGTAPAAIFVTPQAPCILPSHSQKFSTRFVSAPSSA